MTAPQFGVAILVGGALSHIALRLITGSWYHWLLN